MSHTWLHEVNYDNDKTKHMAYAKAGKGDWVNHEHEVNHLDTKEAWFVSSQILGKLNSYELKIFVVINYAKWI